MGYCPMAPPMTVMLMNTAIPVTSIPLPTANTGASDQKAPPAMPWAKEPANPTGDTRIRRPIRTLTCSMGAGAAAAVIATGTAATETRMDAIANSGNCAGSLNVIIICPMVITVS